MHFLSPSAVQTWIGLWSLAGRWLTRSGIVASLLQTSVLLAAELKRDEAVVLYPAMAAAAEAGWTFEVEGLVYELEPAGRTARWLRQLAGVDEKDLTAAELGIYHDRIRYFLADNERGKKLTLRFGTNDFRLSPSAANGRFSGVFRMGDDGWAAREVGQSNGVARLTTWVGDGTTWRACRLEVHVIPAHGWSVISDIDDTIKNSHVRDRRALLRKTFFQPFQPVTGMAKLYQGWADAEAPQFHYLSASPWQLYLPLSEFAAEHGFPPGTFHLKAFRLKDSSVTQIVGSQTGYKSRTIERLLRRFPERRFVLVGDSGEQDPEIYGTVARSFPRQVVRIGIRDVTGEDASSPRYREAFRGLPPRSWIVFSGPEEISEDWSSWK